MRTKEIQCFIDEIHKIEEEDQKNRHLMMINSSISEFLIKEKEWNYGKSLKNRKLRAVWEEFDENKRNSMFYWWDS